MARVRMGAMAVAFGLQHDLDLECLVHFTTRDRNLMAIESELLGAHALELGNVAQLTTFGVIFASIVIEVPPLILNSPAASWVIDAPLVVVIFMAPLLSSSSVSSPLTEIAFFAEIAICSSLWVRALRA